MPFKPFFLGCTLATFLLPAAYSAEPTITSIGPNPVLGTSTDQNFCLNGSGFMNGPGLAVRLTWPTTQMSVPVSFFNPSQLCLTFNFGIAPGNWTAQVVSGDGQLSNIFFFVVAAPGHGANQHLALPHFVFGGVWYSALYLSNTTNALESVQLTFRDNTGTPLFVPLAGIGSLFSRVVILNPGTTVLLEALNVGDDPSTEGRWPRLARHAFPLLPRPHGSETACPR